MAQNTTLVSGERVVAGGTAQPSRELRVRRPNRVATLVVAVGDLCALIAVAAVVNRTPTGVFYLVISVLVLVGTGSVRARLTLRATDAAPRVIQRLALPLLVLVPLAATADIGTGWVLQALISPVAVALARVGSYAAVRAVRLQPSFAQPTIIVGSGLVADQLAAAIDAHPELGLRLSGYVDAEPERMDLPWLGAIDDIPQAVEGTGATCVLIAFSHSAESDYLGVVRQALARNAQVYVVPRFFEALAAGDGTADEVWGIPLQRLRPEAALSSHWRMKRTFDIAASLVALPVLVPLCAALAAAIRLTSPGPALFRQIRIGQHGRPFVILKFRSMTVNDDANLKWSVVDDPRQTPIGRLLRRTNLDELPQIWNVLRGDMSIVGPRPERPYFAREFAKSIPSYDARHRVPAGLTGWAQVHGLRGPETSLSDRVRFDNQYVQRWTLWRDIGILFLTLTAMVREGSE